MDSRYSPQDIEEKWYKTWQDAGAFKPQGDGKPFTIVIPPPNVTGALHMGHALNNTLQDVLIRFKRLQGYRTLWQPGTDHAGIATQSVVEKQLAKDGVKRQDLGREKFVEKVWEWKNEYGERIVNQLMRMGFSCDWSRIRFTMDEGLSKAVREVFVRLHEDGLIYRGTRLINWCPKLQTALADEEVESKETKGHFWSIRYPLAGDPTQFITVSTTRPETMFGDVAVAVNAEDERYKHLIGTQVRIPGTDRTIPIIADEHADPDQGHGRGQDHPGPRFQRLRGGQAPQPQAHHRHEPGRDAQPSGGQVRGHAALRGAQGRGGGSGSGGAAGGGGRSRDTDTHVLPFGGRGGAVPAGPVVRGHEALGGAGPGGGGSRAHAFRSRALYQDL